MKQQSKNNLNKLAELMVDVTPEQAKAWTKEFNSQPEFVGRMVNKEAIKRYNALKAVSNGLLSYPGIKAVTVRDPNQYASDAVIAIKLESTRDIRLTAMRLGILAELSDVVTFIRDVDALYLYFRTRGVWMP